MRNKAYLLSVFALTSTILRAPWAYAQDSAAAQARFDEGVAFMEAKNYAEACPKLEESHRLEPKAGTLYALADCFMFSDAYASAQTQYQKYLDMVNTLAADQRTKHDERVAIARTRLQTLIALVPELKLVVERALPSGTRVFLNEVELSLASLGEVRPVDPGEYDLKVFLDGLESKQHFSMSKGEKREILLELPRRAKPPAEGDGGAKLGMSGMRIGALVAGGVGLLGLGVGAITGAMVLQKKGDGELGALLSRCPLNEAGAYACSGPHREQDKEELAKELDGLKPLATVSTAGFVVGGLGVAAGVALWFLAPKARVESRAGAFPQIGMVWLGPSGGMLGAQGVW